MTEKVSPLLLERYELKFLIHHDLVEPISIFLEQIGCYIDAYAREDKTYLINSLYLDSPYCLFLRKSMNGDSPKLNMRIRSYGDQPKAPYFLEVKYKERSIVKKFRHPLSEEIWLKYFTSEDATPFSSEIEIDAKNYRTFEHLARTYNVEPKILTQYRRKAYLSSIDDYARATFDFDLRFQPADSYIVKPCDTEMTHYDNPLKFPEGCDTILELKCTTQVPLWMLDLIKIFQLKQMSFSKYSSSMLEFQSQIRPQRFDRQDPLDSL